MTRKACVLLAKSDDSDDSSLLHRSGASTGSFEDLRGFQRHSFFKYHSPITNV